MHQITEAVGDLKEVGGGRVSHGKHKEANAESFTTQLQHVSLQMIVQLEKISVYACK